MTRICASTLLAALAAIVVRSPACSGTETWTAHVSDQNCGAKYSGQDHSDCVRKCARGGAAIRHPEWTPQPLVLVKGVDQTVWLVDNPSTLIGLEGREVRAEIKADADGKTVQVRKVSRIPEDN
jgi:hypothetical protein